MFKRLLLLSAASMATVIFISSCSDDPSSINSEPPQLPPVTTMQIDFSSLIGGQQPAGGQRSVVGQQSQEDTTDTTDTIEAVDYYIQAVFKAGSLENLVDRNLSKPEQLLAAAHDAEPELNEEQQWQWSYDMTIDSVSYNGRMVAEHITASTANWSLFTTTGQGNSENRLYFGGTSTGNGEKGTWIIHNPADNAGETESARVDWQGEAAENIDLNLEILSNENGNRGDSLAYAADGANRRIEYYDASRGQTVTTQWDAQSRAGYIIAPDVNNGERACWDETLENVSCDEDT